MKNYGNIVIQPGSEFNTTPLMATIVSGVLTLDCTRANIFIVSHNQNITTMTVEHPQDGQVIKIILDEISSGYTVSWPSNFFFIGGTTIDAVAGQYNEVTATYSESLGTWISILETNSGGGGSGTVTSVALADGSTTPIYSISGSPITGSGTLTFTLNNESAHAVFAGPSSGSAAQPTFRSLVSADIPNNAANTTGQAGSVASALTINNSGSGASSGATFNGSSAVTISYNTVGALGSTGPQTFTGTLTISGGTVTGLNTPSATTDAATKAYVDAIANGLTWKNAVEAATTSALSAAYVGSPTFTLTNNSTQAAFAVDSYTALAGDRILVKNQSTQSQNGIYSVTNTGSGSTNWVLTRTSDFNEVTPIDEINGAAVYVVQGTTQANDQFTVTSVVNTFDSDPIVWTQFAGTSTGVASFSAGTTGFTPNSATTGAVTLAGTLNVVNGGTGTSSTPTSGQFLYSSGGTTYAPTTLSTVAITAVAGTANEITVTTSSGTATVKVPNVFIAPGSIQDTAGIYTSTTNSITATGTTQGTAYGLSTLFNVVTTTSSGTGVQLPSLSNASSGLLCVIVNRGANPLTVYPSSSAKIDGAATNAGVTLAVNGAAIYQAVSTSQWYTIVPNLIAGTGVSVTYGNGQTTVANTGVTALTGTANEVAVSAGTGSVTLSTPSTFLAPGTIQDTSGMMYSTTTGISAAGSTQTTATALTTSYNVVTTVTSGQGVALPTGAAGLIVTVVNESSTALLVYPSNSSKIDNGSTNAAVTLPAGTVATYQAISGTQWYTTDPAIVAGSGITVTYGNGQTTITNAGGGTAANVAISGLTAALGTNSISNGNNAQTWNWSLSGSSVTGLTIGESSASSGSGTTLFALSTLSGTTANAISISADGSNSLQITSTGAWNLGASTLPGTAGQVLTSNGSGSAPTWQSSGGGGASTGLIMATKMGLASVIF